MSPYYSDDFVTLYHGDCREVTEWLAADVLVTDPPYGRAWRQGDTNTRRGWASNRHDGIANDDDSTVRDNALLSWLPRQAAVFGNLMLPPPAQLKHVLIFDKGRHAGVLGAVGGFRRNAEAVYLLGQGWGSGIGGASSILSSNVGHIGRLAKASRHPHAKPVDLCEQLITAAGAGLVADPFAGSGSILVAAKRLGRICIGVEIDEAYCEIAAKRLAQDVLYFGGAA